MFSYWGVAFCLTWGTNDMSGVGFAPPICLILESRAAGLNSNQLNPFYISVSVHVEAQGESEMWSSDLLAGFDTDGGSPQPAVFFSPVSPRSWRRGTSRRHEAKTALRSKKPFPASTQMFSVFFLKAVWPCDGSLTTHSAFSCVLKEEKRKSGSRNPSKGEIFKGRQSGVVGSGTCAEVKSRLHEDLVLLGCRTS